MSFCSILRRSCTRRAGLPLLRVLRAFTRLGLRGCAVASLRGVDLGAGFVYSVQKGAHVEAVQFLFAFAFHGGVGVQQELADVSTGQGVSAIDATESKLREEVAEETVHVLRCGELTHGAQKEIGARGAFAALAFEILTVVVGTERRVGIGSEHAAAIAGLAAIGAEGGRVGFDGDGSGEGGATPCVF
jgi:hypothetical protein